MTQPNNKHDWGQRPNQQSVRAVWGRMVIYREFIPRPQVVGGPRCAAPRHSDVDRGRGL